MRITPLAAPFVACGALDGVLTAVRAHADLDLALVGALFPIVGLWTLAGLVAATLVHVVLRVALGGDLLAAFPSAARAGWTAVWREPDPRRDHARATTALAALVGVATAAAGSIAWLVYLVTHRHGAVLISVTFVVGQAGVLALSLLPACAVDRLCSRWPRLRLLHVVLVTAAGASALTVVASALAWDVLAEIDAPSFALLGVALALGPVVVAREPRVLDGRHLAVIAAMAGVLLVVVPLQSAPVREVVAKRSFTAKRYLSVVQGLSDVDGDGTPALPYVADCAPFDADVHPLAREVDGNGRDENCDGDDRVLGGAGEATSRFGPLEREGPKPNLVLITIDSLRADHVGAFGYQKHPTTPNLDALAQRSVRFSSAFSQDSGTVPSMWSLMVGKTPFQTALETKKRFPPNYAEGEHKLAEALRAGGYHTASILCGTYFARPYWNLKDGFDDWREVCAKKQALVAPVVTSAALEKLQTLSGDEPFFLWVHYFDPHKPYSDHEDLAFGTTTIERYDEEIAYTDRHLAPLLDALVARRERPMYIAISADHGENFGEHGKEPHARTLYREVTNVPLIVYGPDVVARDVDAPVALGDLYPTLLDLAGLPVPDESTMVSQGHVLFGKPPDPARLVFQENSWSRPLRHVKAVVSDRHHMIVDLTNDAVELYDRARDPKERNNLYGSGLAEETQLERRLRDFASTTELPVWLR